MGLCIKCMLECFSCTFETSSLTSSMGSSFLMRVSTEQEFFPLQLPTSGISSMWQNNSQLASDQLLFYFLLIHLSYMVIIYPLCLIDRNAFLDCCIIENTIFVKYWPGLMNPTMISSDPFWSNWRLCQFFYWKVINLY